MLAALASLEEVSHRLRDSTHCEDRAACPAEGWRQRYWRDISVVVGSCGDIVLRAVWKAAKQGPRCPSVNLNSVVVDVILPIVLGGWGLGAIVPIGAEASPGMTYTVSDVGSAPEAGNTSSLVG